MNPERVGRDGFLKLRFARRGNRTILAQSRFSLPLQALTPLTLEDATCYLMLLNPTGGVLGGDHLVTEVVLEPETHVCLSTPSATRIYRTASKPALLDTTIRVGEGATLEYSPDHVIPHACSALRQSLRIDMSQGSRAIILDALASGRVAHGERWSFRELDSRTEVSMGGNPAYISRCKIVPKANRPDRFGMMGEFDYLACMGIFADEFPHWQRLSHAMCAELACFPYGVGGASLLSRGGCAVRFLARSASDMKTLTTKLWNAAREHLLGLPPLDDRKY